MKKHNLHDLLEQKLNAFRNFLSATMALKELPGSENDMEKIESLVDERQDCINRIDKIDNRINRIREESPTIISALYLKEKERIKTTVKTIDDIASRAVHLNREIQTIFQLRYDTVRNRLTRIGHTRSGIQGYARSGRRTHEPRFLNVRS